MSNHAYPGGDNFTLLNRDRSPARFARSDVAKESMLDMMAGGT